jgi:hypothetical protein
MWSIVHHVIAGAASHILTLHCTISYMKGGKRYSARTMGNLIDLYAGYAVVRDRTGKLLYAYFGVL